MFYGRSSLVRRHPRHCSNRQHGASAQRRFTAMSDRPFKVLGVEQIAIGGPDLNALRT